jgi:hypothetical protein
LTGSNWCGVGNPPDVWAGTCVHSQQDGACRRHDMCNVVERLPEPMFGLALACACDRDLYQGSTEDLERTLYGEGEATLPRPRCFRPPPPPSRLPSPPPNPPAGYKGQTHHRPRHHRRRCCRHCRPRRPNLGGFLLFLECFRLRSLAIAQTER